MKICSLLCCVLALILGCSSGTDTTTTPAPSVPERAIFNSNCSTSVVYSPVSTSGEPEILDTFYKIMRYQGDVKEDFDCVNYTATVDSSKFAPQSIVGGGPHTLFTYTPSVPVDVFSNLGLHISLDAVIPEAYGTLPDSNVAQLCVFLYFKDIKSNIQVAYVIALFDSRDSYPETVQSDTYVNFVSTRFNPIAKYVTLVSGSDVSNFTPYTGYKHFELVLKPENFSAGLTDINSGFNTAYSVSPTDYKLVLAGVGSEITNTFSGKTYINFTVKNFQLSTGVSQ